MKIKNQAAVGILLHVWLAGAVLAQEHHHNMPGMEGMTGMEDHQGQQGMDMPGMDMSGMNQAGMFLMNESSGTTFQPSAWPMPMLMTSAGDWRLMWMGQAFVVDTQQSGPRGGDKLYSTNWGMLGAVHKAGAGSIMLRAMMSLEPRQLRIAVIRCSS